MLRTVMAVRFLAVALVLLAAGARAEEPDALAKHVLENIKLSLARLDTVVGESRFSYIQPGQHARTHRVRFSFKKPFSVGIREQEGSFEFAHHAGRVTLYFPRESEVLLFNTEDADAGVVKRLLSLLEVKNFSIGFGLAELGSHFKVAVREAPSVYVTEIVPFANGVWRRVVGLHRIVVHLARDSYLPTRIQVFQRSRPPAPATLAFEMVQTKIEANVPVAEGAFEIQVPPKATRLGTAELVQFVLGSSMKEGKELLNGVAEEVTDRIKRFTNSPWDF
jgi:hypothetical protein